MSKLLIIEDEPTLSRLLNYNLTQAGYEVSVKENGLDGLEAAKRESFDLIILDLMLPKLSGFEVLEKLRNLGNRTPVIILTARNAEEEVVKGLQLGADDYMTKPFGVAEFLARISAVLRRTTGGTMSLEDEQQTTQAIEIGDLRIYPEKYEVTVAGEEISLRPKEFEVLLFLVQRIGHVVTREKMMDAVWGFDFYGGQRTVDVHVSSLRKKLELAQHDVYIESIRGIGYKLMDKSKDRI